MRPSNDEGMCTIDAAKVVDHLNRTNWRRFAEFVRDLGDSATKANRRHTELMVDYLALRERLDRYEPRVVQKPYDPTPPAEASD